MFLVVVNDERGALICEQQLTDELTIGRNDDNAIILPSSNISRHHAILYVENGQVYIQDLQSINSIFVDDRKVEGTSVISEDSIIRVGIYRIFIENISAEQNEREGFQTAVVHPNQAHGKLVISNGPQAGKEFFLFEPISSVGRTEENEVTLAHISVSRHHAQVKRKDDGSYIITDPGSSNGTFVRHKRVVSALQAWHGDMIRFGQIECLLVDPNGQARANKPWLYYVLILVMLYLGYQLLI